MNDGQIEARRLFLAVPLPAVVKAELISLIDAVRRSAPRSARWVRPEQLHVTLKFLGDVEPEQQEALTRAMQSVCTEAPFRFTLQGVGAFPNRRQPRVIWTGIQSGCDHVAHLAGLVEAAACEAGFDPERRRFSPHVTLARVKQPGDFKSLWDQVDAVPFTSQEVDAVDVRLIHSTLTPQGAVYRDVESFQLRGTKEKT